MTQVVEAAPELGIGVLTIYAFSADNWRRPPREVAALMRLFRSYLAAETARCVQNGVRLVVIGRRDRLAPALMRAIDAAESATLAGCALLLRVAIDYSARDAIVAAAADGLPEASREAFAERLAAVTHSPPVPEVDLLIRTGAEERLSDFLLWECAYAELVFDECMWPDYDIVRLEKAIRAYRARDRRFGGLARAAAS